MFHLLPQLRETNCHLLKRHKIYSIIVSLLILVSQFTSIVCKQTAYIQLLGIRSWGKTSFS